MISVKKEFIFVLSGLAIGLVLISFIKKKRVILFMGGLENNKTLKEQVLLFKKYNKNEIISHTYKEVDKLKNNISNYPNSKLVLFSAGGKYANDFANIKNPKDIYVIEPYTCNRTITEKIPKSNIYVGSSCDTGSNIQGIKRSDYNGKNHFSSLVQIGKVLN